MATYWFISAPLVSHTDWGGFLRTAQVLQSSGDDVLWISDDRLRGWVERQGVRFRAVRETGWLWPPPPQPDFSKISPQEAVTLRYTRALDTWLSEDLVAEGVRALVELADEIGAPDAIVSDPFLSAAALGAESIGTRFIVCGWPAQASLDSGNLFPVQQMLGSDSQQRIERLCGQFDLKGKNFSPGPTPSILSPHLHICYFVRRWYMAEAHTLMHQNEFVGGVAAQPQSAPPQWLADIPEATPLCVVTLGTTFTGDLGFFSWGAQAAASAGLVPVVVIGNNPIEPTRKQELVRALPGGTRLLNWVPFDHVLPRSALIIHHGGMGTTHHAVAHGVPQIVVPHAADQRVQGKRVSQAKVGLNLTAHDVQKGLLLEGARAIIKDDKVKKTAQNLAKEMAAQGGAEAAARAIGAVIGN